MGSFKDYWDVVEKLIRLFLDGKKENKIDDCKTMIEYYNNHREYRVMCIKKNIGDKNLKK